MKIMMVTSPVCPPWDNGTKNLAYSLATRIKNEHFYLLTTKNCALQHDNITFEKIYTNSKAAMSLLQQTYLFIEILKSKDVDIFHFIFRPNELTSFASKRILNFKKKKSIQTIHNIIPEGIDIKKLVFADYLVVSSDYMKDKFINAGIKNVFKINPGIDQDEFKPKPKDSMLLEKFRINKDELIVLYAGDYTNSRGVDCVADALPIVFNARPDTKFIFACRVKKKSEEDREEDIKTKVNRQGFTDKIIFLRTFPNMYELINLCDISILPLISTIEKVDIPLVLLESLALEKPIVISNVEPLTEIMKSEVGLVVEPRDSKSLSKALIRLLSDHKLRQKMGKNGRQMIKDHFTADKTAFEYSKLYQALIT